MIAILLATYNSEKYIVEQIDSILSQGYKDWILFAHDDGSTDNTVSIIDKYVSLFPEKIKFSKNKLIGLGAYKSFLSLLEEVDSDYYMFCDHDDVWLSFKLDISMKRMWEMESLYPLKPIVVHSDMKVVDQNLNVISNSFWSYSKYLPNHVCFEELVCCNCVNGCTMLFNRAAKNVSKGNEKYCLMHDTYISQSVASSGGIITAIVEPTVLYRQHLENVIGAANRNKLFFLKRGFIQPLDSIKVNYKVWKRVKKMHNLSFFRFLYFKLKIIILRYFKR